LNPPDIVETTFFTVETFSSSDYVINFNYSIPGKNFDRRAVVGTLIHNSFYANPDNGGYEANLFIDFLPEYIIPINSVITVMLPPGEYSGLSGTQSCRLSGGL